MGLTEWILKARSGVYADTPENRRLHRVGQRYGSQKQWEDRFEQERNKRAYQQEVSDKQATHSEKLVEELKKIGITGVHIDRSITSFGVSTYVQGNGLKFRISDHSTTNVNRVLNEIPFSFNSDLKEIAAQGKRELDEKKKIVAARNEAFDKRAAKEKELDEYWESIKDEFKDKVFKQVNRTYQDIETFSKGGKHPRANIHQRELNGGAFAYEWTEPTTYNRWGRPENPGKQKPSYSWLEWHRSKGK